MLSFERKVSPGFHIRRDSSSFGVCLELFCAMSRLSPLRDFATFKWSDVQNGTFDQQVDTMNDWCQRLMDDQGWKEDPEYIFKSNESGVSVYSLLVVPLKSKASKKIINYQAQVLPVDEASENIKSYLKKQEINHKICIMTSDWSQKNGKFIPSSGHTQGLVILKAANGFEFFLYHSYYKPQFEYENRTVINTIINTIKGNYIHHCVQKEFKNHNMLCFPSSLRFLHQFIHEQEPKIPKIKVSKSFPIKSNGENEE